MCRVVGGALGCGAEGAQDGQAVLPGGGAAGDGDDGGALGDRPTRRYEGVQVPVPSADRSQAHRADEGQVAGPVAELAQGQIEGAVGGVAVGVDAGAEAPQVVVVGGPAGQDAGDGTGEVVLVELVGYDVAGVGERLGEVFPQCLGLPGVG